MGTEELPSITKEKMTEKTLKVIRGIGQALANAYDGALDENGEPLLAGLKR